MSLDRLTEKAKDVLERASEIEKLTAKKLMQLISETDGLGRYLIEKVPPVTVKKLEKINLEALLKEAYFQAIRLEHTYVGTEHFYLALLKMNNSRHLNQAKVELVSLGVYPNKVEKSPDLSKQTPLLDLFGEDLNQLALRTMTVPLVYREEYEKLLSTLLLKEKSNALLVGEPGVGKRTLVKLLAHNINSLDVPPALVGYHLRSLNLLSFMTSIANKGGMDFGIAALMEELKSLKRVVLVLEGFQDIFYSTPAGMTIPIFYSVLKGYFEKEGVSIVTYLTPSIHEKITLENDHIIDNFTVIELDEPSEEEVKEILKLSAKQLEEFHKVNISGEVLDHVYTEASEKIKGVKFPQKALDLLDYTCAYVITKKSKIPESYKNLVDESFDLASELDAKLDEGNYKSAVRVRSKIAKVETKLDQKEHKIFSEVKTLAITTSDVDKVLSEMDFSLSADAASSSIKRFGKIASGLRKEIIGQEEAIDVVSKALVRAKLGLRSRKRPLGNFLFLGPTGVGKTELAKILAKVGFSKEDSDSSSDHQGLIRLDMSDFSEKHNVARLVGAPPGYVGYGEGGELTSKIESHPESVVLFDEIEKAHPDVLNILLQIMEEGELSDARGNTFDFSKAVVILTSNLGTDILHNKGIGFEEKDIQDKDLEKRLKENLKKILKPELLNRFDEIVVFKRLTRQDLMLIVELLLDDVKGTLKKQDVSLKVLLTAKKWLIEHGYSKEYGARALRRTIEKELLDQIAEILLQHEERPLKLKARADNGKLTVSIEKVK